MKIVNTHQWHSALEADSTKERVNREYSNGALVTTADIVVTRTNRKLSGASGKFSALVVVAQ